MASLWPTRCQIHSGYRVPRAAPSPVQDPVPPQGLEAHPVAATGPSQDLVPRGVPSGTFHKVQCQLPPSPSPSISGSTSSWFQSALGWGILGTVMGVGSSSLLVDRLPPPRFLLGSCWGSPRRGPVSQQCAQGGQKGAMPGDPYEQPKSAGGGGGNSDPITSIWRVSGSLRGRTHP